MRKHPIALPSNQIDKWLADEDTSLSKQFQEAARMGADMELDACCEWLDNEIGAGYGEHLRNERRPERVHSIKTEALDALDEVFCSVELPPGCYSSILKALEQLDD